MRSRTKSTINAAEVQSQAAGWIQRHLKFGDYSAKCTWWVTLSVLLFAAARRASVHDACGRLRRAPSDETIRQAVAASLPDEDELQRRVNAALADRLPKRLFKTKQPIAIDLTEIPYHGQPWADPEEVRRGQPKSGTTHFHAYASAYVVRHGQRFTVAVTPVKATETMDEVVKRLLRLVRAIGLTVRFLLLDKGFFSAEVVRYLQAARCPFLIPAFARGRKPDQPTPGSLHAFRRRKASGWASYSWTSKRGVRATVSLAIVCKNYRGQRDRHGRRTQLYACWGLPSRSTDWVYQTYRKRFGIETSYRQMHTARIRTTTRHPLVRFLYVALALILRNVWVWCHLNWLAVRRGPGLEIREELLRLSEMLFWLEQTVQEEFGVSLQKAIPPPV